MDRINGFACSVDYSGNGFCFNLKHDGFSVHNYEDDDVLVCVQTSLKCRDEAETLASAYMQCKQEYCPARVTSGSFIIIDKKKHLIYAGRDRNQASHLYIFRKGELLLISTDMHYFFDYCKVVDAVALNFAIMKGIVLAPFPILKGLKALLPGKYVQIESIDEIKENTFWKIEKTEVPQDYKEAVCHYAQLLMNSIKNNVSNDCAAVYLSGGSDSAAVMGALDKLGVGHVYATHMAIQGNFEFEREDVGLLHKKYNFNLELIKPEYENVQKWKEYVDKALLQGSINSIYTSFPTYQLMGRRLSDIVSKGTTVFNGEMCLLDQGFNESGDNTRTLRRWLFVKNGRRLAYGLKIVPDFVNVDWNKHRRPYFIRKNWGDKLFVLDCATRSILHAVGRPSEYFAGLKLGYHGMPGYFFGLSLLPIGYQSDAIPCSNAFFEDFFARFNSKEWKMYMAMLSTCWYSESSNFTMPNDTAALGGLTMCFPFSSVELMDFAASVPTEWAIDKKIQKDACKMVFDMPDQVAYRMKNHKQKFSYGDVVYGAIKDEMIKTILETDFGPLNENISKLIAHKPTASIVFNLYGYALWIRQYNLIVE